MNDSLLKLMGKDINAAATVSETGKFLGRNRSFNAVCRVGGDVTGAGAALTFVLEESTALTGSYTAIPGTGTVTLVEMAGSTGTQPKSEIPGSLAVRVPFITTKDYVRVTSTTAGTSPVFPGVSIYADPINNAVVPSGR